MLILFFNSANGTDSFKFKAKITCQTDDDGEIKNVEIRVPLKYLGNLLANCEVNLILAWSTNCVIVYTNVANQGDTFEITETNLYVPVVAL